MKILFDFADKFNMDRKPLELPIHWVPSFVLSIWSFLKWFIKFFTYVYFLFFPFLFGISGIVSGSMTPTCQTNELVLSSRLGYGISIEKILQILPIKFNISPDSFLTKTFWAYDEPKLGDVIAMHVSSVDQESTYTKRIVGNEGDSVQFKNGILFINKEPVKLIFKKKYTYFENNKYYSGSLYEEILPNGVKHDVLYLYTLGSGSLDNTEEFLVPKGHVFCVGDNRHGSDDSRSLFAFIDKKEIYGKVVMILFSNGNLTSLSVNKFISGMRWDRCLKWMI